MFEDEKIVETKTCKHCDVSFDITDKDLKFYEKVSPVFGGKRYLIPSPDLCPDCRQQRRFSFRNERKIYKRKCDFSGKDIVSIYSPDKPYKVYHQDIWWSDKWDALTYGRDFDFSKGFFEQFKKLSIDTPLNGLYQFENENCEYTNSSSNSKNCYYCFVCTTNEDCIYSHIINNSSNVVDGYMIFESQNCYNCVDCIHCYECYYGVNLEDCKNCYSSTNLINCDHCIDCSNLANASYMIKNKEVSKDDFIKYRYDLKFNKAEFYNSSKISQSTNVSGDYLYACSDSYFCFDLKNSESVKYCVYGNKAVNSYDCYAIYPQTELCYNCIPVGFNDYNIINSYFVYESKNVAYSFFCKDCSDCFGCMSLNHKQYCIFNKQYTKEEYEKLVPKIIEKMQETGEWGEFFPSSLSPFGYNETIGTQYFPLEKNIALKDGFKWSDYEAPFPKVEKIIKADSLPGDISKIPDDILNWAVECEKTGKPFRIIKQELEFYRKHNLPIPKRHPDLRHLDRIAFKNPRKIYDRKCDKCGKDIKTTYSPDRKEIIYCEECYNKEIY